MQRSSWVEVVILERLNVSITNERMTSERMNQFTVNRFKQLTD